MGIRAKGGLGKLTGTATIIRKDGTKRRCSVRSEGIERGSSKTNRCESSKETK